jgi:hypothetical protein
MLHSKERIVWTGPKGTRDELTHESSPARYDAHNIVKLAVRKKMVGATGIEPVTLRV